MNQDERAAGILALCGCLCLLIAFCGGLTLVSAIVLALFAVALFCLALVAMMPSRKTPIVRSAAADLQALARTSENSPVSAPLRDGVTADRAILLLLLFSLASCSITNRAKVAGSRNDYEASATLYDRLCEKKSSPAPKGLDCRAAAHELRDWYADLGGGSVVNGHPTKGAAKMAEDGGPMKLTLRMLAKHAKVVKASGVTP